MATTESVTTPAARRLLGSYFRASGASSERTGSDHVAELHRYQDKPAQRPRWFKGRNGLKVFLEPIT
jgi:hypothetical protein